MSSLQNTGPEAILRALEALDLDSLEEEQREVIRQRKKTARPRAVRLINIIDGLKKNKIAPGQLMIRQVPVIPPKFRPFAITGNTFLPGDANELYKDLVEYRRLYERTAKELGDESAGEVYADMNKAVRAVYGYGDSPNPKTRARSVKGFFETVTGSSPKTSIYQSKMLSKPVDTVGRGVIIPDADYDMDDIGIPEEMGWKLYGNYAQRSLVRGGMSPGAALKHVKERSPQALKALESTMKDRPVVMTRSPAWHKFNVIGQNARLVKGDAIRINTFVTEGQNADFDGDQCINQIFACIAESDAQSLRMSYHNLDLHEIRFPSSMCIPAIAGSKCYMFDLEDFPAGELLASKEATMGRIDLHAPAVPIKVLSYDEETGGLLWADVSHWSKHYDRLVEIVDTHNGFQLVTDDDPRAVYGTAAGALKFERFTPTQALNAKVLLPRAARVPAAEASVDSVTGVTDAIHEGCGYEPHRMRPVVRLTERVGWFLGALAGDGWVIKAHGIAKGFALADNDGRNVAKLTAAFPDLYESSFPSGGAVEMAADEEGRLGDTVSYRFSSALLGRWLRDLIGGERDDTTAGSGNKHLPPFFMASPLEFRQGLFAGLMDTDGSISTSRAKGKPPQLMASMLSTSIRLVQETRLLAGTLGIRGRITPTTTPKGKPAWMLTFSNGDIQTWGGMGMVRQDKVEHIRNAPLIGGSPATGRYDIVPVPAGVALALRAVAGCPKLRKEDRKLETTEVRAKKARQSLHVILTQAANPGHSKYGIVSREVAVDVIAMVGRERVSALPGGAEWLRVVDATDVTWERVVGVQKTGIRETGYDLTVPGYETFMSADGVILSNTSSIHVPSTPEAVKDVRERMMASKMLWSIKDRNKVLAAPKHEQILGLTMGHDTGGKKRKFATDDEAMKAIEEGQIDLNDDIEIGE